MPVILMIRVLFSRRCNLLILTSYIIIQLYTFMLKKNKALSPSSYLDEFFVKGKEETVRPALRQELMSPPPNLNRYQRKNKQQPVKGSSLTTKLLRRTNQQMTQGANGKIKNLKEQNALGVLNSDYYIINRQDIRVETQANVKPSASSTALRQKDAEEWQVNAHSSLPTTNMFYGYLSKDKRQQQSISTQLSKQEENRMTDFKDGSKEVKFATAIATYNKFSKKEAQVRSPSILKNSHQNILNPSVIASKSRERERSSSAISCHERRSKEKTLNENNNTNKNIKLKYKGIISKLQSEHIGKNVRVNRFSAACYNTEKHQKNQQFPKFKDELFPPLHSSLFIQKPKEKKGQEIFWMRIPQVFPKRELIIYKPLHLSTEIVKTELSYASDYIVSAFNCMAASPKLLQKIFQDQEVSAYGIYIVKIYQQNAWKFIIIDDFIPVLKDKEGKVVPAFLNINCKPEGPLQIWPFLLQKAYANYYARYEALQHGNALDFVEQFAGSPSLQIKVKEVTKKSMVVIKEKNLAKLKKQLKNGQTLALGQLSEGKIYIPLVYSILNETLYMSDPYKNFKRKAISFQNLVELCTTVYLIDPFKYASCKTAMIRRTRPKPQTERSDGLYLIEHPSIRSFKVQEAGDFTITIKQRQNRLYYFKGDLKEYIWIRAILVQKEYGENGFRWIDGQYNQKKSLIFTHFLQAGQYWILTEPEWKSSSPNQLFLQVYSLDQLQITREIYNDKAKVIESACLDLSQRYGELNQINKFICSYNYVTEKVGLIIENIINERVSGDVTVMRSIRGLKCKVQILPINKEFYEAVSIKGQQYYRIQQQIELDIRKGDHFTVVLKLKGGMDHKFFKSFDFGC